jgi:hypothetical protein
MVRRRHGRRGGSDFRVYPGQTSEVFDLPGKEGAVEILEQTHWLSRSTAL